MRGFVSLHGWEDVMRGSLAVVGVFGLIVGISTFFVVKLQRLELAEANREMTEYKLAATRDIATAQSAGEAAKAEAAKAQLELAKFKAPRTLSSEQVGRISAKLLPFASTQFDMGVGPQGDPEPDLLGQSIYRALLNAKWVPIDWATRDASMTLGRPGLPTFGSVAVTNLIVDIHPSQTSKLWPIAQALAEALAIEGIAAEAQQGSGGRNTNENAIHVMIGRKL